jgi:hypothetical protein
MIRLDEALGKRPICCYIGIMIRISITEAAYAAIASSLSENIRVKPNADSVSVWLPRVTVMQLERLRGPGDSYSDVIMRLASLEAAQ